MKRILSTERVAEVKSKKFAGDNINSSIVATKLKRSESIVYLSGDEDDTSTVRRPYLYLLTNQNETNDDVLIIEDNNFIELTETKPSTSTAAAQNEPVNNNENEVNLIQSIFPSIDRNAAIEIIQRVNEMPNSSLSNSNGRETILFDYIFNNHLNDVPETIGDIEKDLESIRSVIIDCDPEYIREKLKSMPNNNRRAEIIIADLIEKKSYPKLKDYLNKIAKEKEVDKLLDSPLDIGEFLKIFPEPFNWFYKNNRVLSESYKVHCRITLMNKFDFIADETIDEVLAKNKYHLILAYKQLQTAISQRERELKQRAKHNLDSYLQRRNLILENTPQKVLMHIPKIKFTKSYVSYKLNNVPRVKQQYPDILDANFFREMQFIKNEDQIKSYINEKDQKRKQKFENAKLTNSLLECPCCFDDELLEEDLLSCPDGHVFCKECIKRYIETSVGDCKYEFNCINDKCKLEYEMSTLSAVLEPNMFSKLLRNIQNEEIKKAGLENLESCQHCTYAAIIENPLDKVFRCLNPECLKETCRLCKEPNHLPLRCNEIEKSDEVSMRTWIENKVTEAMIRQCHKCQKRFFKVEGCNMMHCVCGAQMCYICRQPIKDYKHFSDSGCQQFSDVAELHQIEMEKAYKEANEIYLKEHPESVNISLKHDPKKILEELNKEKEKNRQQQLQLHNQHIQQIHAEHAQMNLMEQHAQNERVQILHQELINRVMAVNNNR